MNEGFYPFDDDDETYWVVKQKGRNQVFILFVLQEIV